MSITKWALDPGHSEVQFKVKHMMISTVTGHIKNFTASIETNGDDLSTAKIHFSADADSVSTNNEQRDGHLKTGDFLDVANHPKITFKSSKLEKVDNENYKLHGTLNLRGVAKPVTLDVEYGGTINDPYKNVRSGFTIHGKIDRKDFGLTFNMLTETGGLVMGNDITINSNVEFIKQK